MAIDVFASLTNGQAILSGPNVTAAGVSAGTGGLTAYTNGGSGLSRYMSFHLAAGGYYGFQQFWDFDLSSVSANDVGSVSISFLNIQTKTGPDADNDVYQVRAYDFGASLTTADWRTSAQFAALDLLAHVAWADLPGSGSYVLAPDNLKAATIAAAGGRLRVCVCTALYAAAGTPTSDTYVGVGDLGNYPAKLTITPPVVPFSGRPVRLAYLRR